MAGNDVVTATNEKLIGAITGIDFMRVIGWIFFIIIVAGACVYAYIIWKNKKIFKKKITAFDSIGINFEPVFRDLAKTVKFGSGGFEILYLKKLKTYKIAYGGKVGKDTYYFFIMPDGYWYNGMLSSNISAIDKNGGFIPVVTTNPLMRSQYTSLEKSIDTLHENKKNFWDTYGSWILSIGFILVAGVMLWLNYKEYVVAMNSLSGLIDKIANLVDKVDAIQGGTNPTGLIKV